MVGRGVAARLVWIVAIATAGHSQDAPANPCVVRRAGLPNPRKLLRYRGRLREMQPLQLVMSQELRRETEEGGAPQKQQSPRVTLSLEITPVRFENGITFFRVRVAKAEASGGTVGPEQLTLVRRGAGALNDLVGEGAVAQDGSGAELQWVGADKLPPDSQGIAEQARHLLLGAFVPLPDVPMGEDGRWVVPATEEGASGEPQIKETEFTCSIVGDGASISAFASASSSETRRTAANTVRDKVTTEMRGALKLEPGRLFPTLTTTSTRTAHYASGEKRFADRQSMTFELRGADAPEPMRIALLGAGEEPRIPIEYPAALRSRRYAIEYTVRETEAMDGRVVKRGEPRVRVVARCRQWPQSEPRFTEGYVMQWSVEEAGPVGSDARGLADALGRMGSLGGGGAYGRSCEAIAGYAPAAGPTRLRMKRQPMEPELWLELPEGDAAVEQEARRLCETIEWSMLRLPGKRYEAPAEEDRDPAVIVPMMGKGGAWRAGDEIPIPGAQPLKRVIEYTVAEVVEGSFTVACRSEDEFAQLGAAALERLPEGSKAELKACAARRTGSWTLARDHAMPLKANVEDILDREYEVTARDGSTRTVRFHTVRSVTIEALD